MKRRRLSEQAIATLLEVARLQQGETGRAWIRPENIGGRRGSRHSSSLRTLVRRGLVETQRIGYGYGHHFRYRLTDEGWYEVERQDRRRLGRDDAAHDT